jgi:fucose 4-O-acetylase-like acetyltransferase
MAIVAYHAAPPTRVADVLITYGLTLFFMISGFLFRDDENSAHPWEFVWRRFKRLYVPFVAWNLLYLSLHNLLFGLGIYTSQAGFQGRVSALYTLEDVLHVLPRIVAFRSTEPLGGGLWFLPMLFAAEVYFVAISWAAMRFGGRYREALRAVAVSALAVAGYAGQTIIDQRIVEDRVLVAVSVLYLGLLLRRVESRLPWRWYFAAACAVALVLLGGAVDLGANRYAGPVHLVAVSLCGAYANLSLGRRFESSRILNYIGRNTIFILATHFAAFKLVSLAIIHFEGYPSWGLAESAIRAPGLWWAAYFIAGVTLPTAAKYGIDILVSVWRQRRTAAAETDAATA